MIKIQRKTLPSIFVLFVVDSLKNFCSGAYLLETSKDYPVFFSRSVIMDTNEA